MQLAVGRGHVAHPRRGCRRRAHGGRVRHLEHLPGEQQRVDREAVVGGETLHGHAVRGRDRPHALAGQDRVGAAASAAGPRAARRRASRRSTCRASFAAWVPLRRRARSPFSAPAPCKGLPSRQARPGALVPRPSAGRRSASGSAPGVPAAGRVRSRPAGRGAVVRRQQTRPMFFIYVMNDLGLAVQRHSGLAPHAHRAPDEAGTVARGVGGPQRQTHAGPAAVAQGAP